MRAAPRRPRASSGIATVEFAIIAPVLIMAVLSMADIGFAIHNSSEIDQAIRNGAEAAMRDPGKAGVEAVLNAVNATGEKSTITVWSVNPYCACPEATSAHVDCSTTCANQRPTARFYSITGVRAYSGFLLPARDLTRSATIQIR